MDDAILSRWRRFRISNEKAQRVAADIANGSTPAAGFYALIATASLIASLGLVANSPAVIIGAMLVSPLMSPIFGLALGMIRGDAHLLGKAVRAEISGMALAVAFGALFGLLPVMTEITPEMLARTEPTLLDLLVAVFAGFAGTLAMVDDRISPALPGVAIATAIVPPLVTCGLCLSHGAHAAASGALLLFFANFVAILLVSSVAFTVAGLARRYDAQGKPLRLAGNLAVTILGFLLISAYLTHSLATIVRDRHEDEQVRAAIGRVLDEEPAASLVNLGRKDLGDRVDVLATIRTPHPLDPAFVAAMEEAVAKELGKKVRLGVRGVISKDFFPPGGGAMVAATGLDGSLFTDNVPDGVKRLQVAEQTLREMLASQPQMLLLDVNMANFGGEPVVMATIQSLRTPLPEEIAEAEQTLRRRMGVPNLRLLARCQTPEDVASDGRILLGKAHFGPKPPKAVAVRDAVRQELAALPGLFVTATDVAPEGDAYLTRVDVTGERLVSPAEVRDIEARVSNQAGATVKLAVRSQVGLLVTRNGGRPMEEYVRERTRATREAEERLPERAGPPASTAP
jgi:uncharacterized hydrophobic protein (TIGR00271 family)